MGDWSPRACQLFCQHCRSSSVSRGSAGAGTGRIIEGDPAMRIFRRRQAGTDADEIAMHAPKHSGSGRITAVVSAIALLFSGFSLWETSLKRADLSVYVAGVVTYSRDNSASLSIMPSGGFEVIALPVTIANSGARDAPVLGLQLDVKNPQTGLSARFEATYIAEASYFNTHSRTREKTPFSALVLAGRTAWRGTVVFYPISYSNGKSLTPVGKVREFNDMLRTKYATEMGGASSISVLREKLPNLPELAELDAYYAKVVEPDGKAEMTLKLIGPAPGNWLDRALDAPIPPIRFTLQTPALHMPDLLKGEPVRLRSVNQGT